MTALTDATAEHRQALETCFPGDPAEGWPVIKERFPETLGSHGRWRLPINVFLVRTPEITMLVDSGVGGSRTVAAEVFQVVGSLPDRLARLGLLPQDLQAVLFTHLHEDHIGWANAPETGEPTFPNARYLVHRGEWEANHSGQGTPDWVRQSLDPIDQRGRLDLIELGALIDGLEVVGLPGHTPGHCGLVVTGTDTQVTLIGDAFNHPHQVSEPEIPSIADGDRAQAAVTRRAIIERASSGDWPTLGSAHLPGGWWAPVTAGTGARWQAGPAAAGR